MSDFGLFEADHDAEQAPRRKQRIAARQMSAALTEVHRRFEAFLANADGVDNFEDRFAMSRKDIANTMIAHGVGAYPAVMREVHGSLKSAWYARHGAAEGFAEPKNDKDRDMTINDKQKSKIDKGEKPGKEDVKTNTGDGSDAEGLRDDNKADDDHGKPNEHGKKSSRRRTAEDRDAPLLVPGGDFDGYLDSVDQGGPEKVDAHDFIPPTSDVDRREAMQLVADIYNDWAQGNNLRVASMNTLDVYASGGLHDDDYFLLASLIRKAECDCDDDDDKDTDGPDGPDKDTDGPPSHADSDSDSDSDDDDSDEDDSEDSDDSDGDSDSSGDNPFAGSDDSDSDWGDDSDADAAAPPDDGGDPDAGPPEDDGFPGDPNGLEDAGDDVGGQDFTVPEQAPELPGDEMSQLEQGGPQSVPPEVIDDILGLPPGTLEQLINEELGQAGGGAPPPPSGPPPQLARRKRAAEVDPTQAAGGSPSAAPAAPAQMPAAPPPGVGSAGTMAPPGSASVAPPPAPMPLENQPAEDALLDTALQAVTQMVDKETQEYQQVIDPLTQALQAIEFAQQVEQAENPLDVTPPEGTVDAAPSAAPGGADSAQKAARIANRYQLSRKGYDMLMEAMSRKHYEHVAEAIRTLPPELRPGIAAHIGGMFHDDNPRFNNDRWMESVGGITASRRPFVGRTAGENLKNTPTLDAFEFPGQGAQVSKPEISDNNKLTDLPKMKGAAAREAKDVLKKWDDWTKVQTDKGLNVGGDAELDQFVTEKKIGPKATETLKNTIAANRRQASFFTRRVPGWRWDDHLAGYVSREARTFECSCGNEIPAPSYGMCRCGKLWNSYAIGDNSHLASGTAEMLITREIPVRADVIMANRRLADDRGYESFDAYGKGDTEWVTDEEREHADAPHAPGQTASRRQACWPGCHEDEAHAKKFHKDSDDEGTEKSAAVALAWDAAQVVTAGMVGEPVTRHDDPSFQGVVTHADPSTGTAWVKHPGGHHEMNITDLASSGTPPQGPSLKDKVRNHLMQRVQNGGFAGGRSAFFEGKLREDDYIVKYDDDEDPARSGGPKKPPSTTLKGGDPKWHSREDGGKFKSTSPFRG